MRARRVLGLVFVLALVVSACGDDDATTTTAAADLTKTPGVLTVGSDIPYPPFEDFDSDGNEIGFDVELIEEIASRLDLTVEWVDTDADGALDVCVHSSSLAAVVRPSAGGALTELTHLDLGVNVANTLTRRRESYHRTTPSAAEHGGEASPPETASAGAEAGAMPSIHEIEESVRVESLPPVDADVRALFLDRVLSGSLDLGDVELVHPGDSVDVTVRLGKAVPMEPGLGFAVREGNRTVAAGAVTAVLD